jgi:MFS family permease
MAVVATDLSRDLGLDAAERGMISVIWFVAFAFAQFPVGWALDRFGPRRTSSSFMTGAVAGATLLALSTNYAGALASMALEAGARPRQTRRHDRHRRDGGVFVAIGAWGCSTRR